MQEAKPLTLITSSSTPLNNSFKGGLETGFQPAKKTVVSTIAGSGIAGLADGPVLTAKFRSPLDVLVMTDGTIYVADGFNSCIRKIAGGYVTIFAGNGNANIRNGNSIEARFKIPCRLTSDVNGDLYLLDAADPRIRKITPAANVSTYAGTSTFGFRNGDASIARFGQSFGIVADAQRNIYIADTQNDCIRKIGYNGQVTTLAGTQGFLSTDAASAKFYFVKGVVIDKLGNLFVADFNRIYKISPEGVVSTFAGNGIKGYTDGAPEIAQFSQIEDMVIDEEQNIYLTEDHRIRKIAPQGIVSTVAGSTAGYKDGDAIAAKFNEPKGLGIDEQGNIYVADSGNNRIRKISFV
jgi:sugar lactone lactonase YvrE